MMPWIFGLMGCVVLVLLFYLDADSARLAGPERCRSCHGRGMTLELFGLPYAGRRYPCCNGSGWEKRS
jgi:hypothetical protein